MEVKIEKENGKELVSIIGRLDTTTAAELERAVAPLLEPGKEVIFECKDLAYISSSGLRVILLVYKKLSATGGSFLLRNVQPAIKSVFDMTGFSNILKIN